jgi:preprotein translocase subunit YajC
MFTKVNIPSSLVDAVKSITEKKEMEKEELKGDQHKIDMNKNNKVDAHDFAILRSKKKMKEETELTEDHFKIGDKVKCKESGMTGEVVKLDKPSGEDDEEYYTVKREDGKTMKYAPEDLTLMKEEKDGGASKKQETTFHKKLDTLVHKTFGKRKEEMKEEAEQIDELSKSTLASYAKKATHDARMKFATGKDFERVGAKTRKPEYKAGAKKWEDKYKSDARRREAGVGKAIDRLAKEGVEIEEIDEASYSAKSARAGKDIGKPGKMFSKIASSAAKRYGSKESGEKVAGAVLAKLRMKEDVDMDIDDADVEEILNIVEKTLTEPEMKKREDVVKSMKKGFSGFRKRYGDNAKSVMYATATKIAKEKA